MSIKISVATDTTPPLATDMLPLARAGDNTARKITVGNLRGVFNVKDYGASPANSGAVNLSAFITALAAATPTGATVYVPSGDYTIAGGLPWGPSRASLVGEGLRTILRFTAQTGPCLEVSYNPGDNQFGNVFEKFQIIGDGVADATKAHCGLYAHGITGTAFRDISISQTGGPALKLSAPTYFCSFDNLTLFRPVGADTNDVPYLHLYGDVSGNYFRDVLLRSIDTSVDGLSGGVRLEMDAGHTYVPSRNAFYSLATENMHIPDLGSLVRVDGSENLFQHYTDFDSVSSATGTTNTAKIRFLANAFGLAGGNSVTGSVPGGYNATGTSIAWGVILEGSGDRIEGACSFETNHVLLKLGAARNFVSLGGVIGPNYAAAITDSSGQSNVIIDMLSGYIALRASLNVNAAVASSVDGFGGGFYAGAALDVQWSRQPGPKWYTPAGVQIDGNLQLNSPAIGFFSTAAVAKPTGVAVTAAAIHAALVTLGLISA